MRKPFWIVTLVAVAGIFWSVHRRQNLARQLDTEPAVTLNLYAFSDYFPDEVIKKFEDENHVKVHYDVYASNEELLAKLQAGATGYDVIVPSDYMVRTMVLNNMLMELDKNKIPNIKNLAEDFQKTPYDSNNQHSVPYTWGTTGILYNSKFVKTNDESWQLAFDKKYAGRVALLDDMREVMGAMLRIDGKSVNSTDKTELRAAQGRLKKLKSNVRVFSSDPRQHVLNGDIWIAQAFSGDANQIRSEHPEFHYFVPKEGGVMWIDTLAIPESAPHSDLAYKFINTILDPAVDKAVTEKIKYASPNAAMNTQLTNEELRPEYLKKIRKGQLEFLNDLGPATKTMDQIWSEAKIL